jgi:hypothetical protein
MYALACTPAKSSGASALLLGPCCKGSVLMLLLALAVLVSGMNRLMLRSPLGLLLTWLTRVWPTAGGAGWSVRGGKRVGLGPLGLSAAGGGGAEDLRLDLTGLRPLGDLGVCIAMKCVVELQYGRSLQQSSGQTAVSQIYWSHSSKGHVAHLSE